MVSSLSKFTVAYSISTPLSKVVPLSQYVANCQRRWRFWLDLIWAWSGGLCIEMEIVTNVVPLSQHVVDNRRRWRFWLDLIWAWSGGLSLEMEIVNIWSGIEWVRDFVGFTDS